MNHAINPQTGKPIRAIDAFAAWLAVNEPELFNALAKRAGTSDRAPGLGSFSSIMSDIGSGLSSTFSDIGSGISDVGSYLTSSGGLSSLTSLANTYLVSQNQQKLTSMQLQLAKSGQPPAPVSYQTTSSGAVVPVYSGGGSVSTVPVTLSNGTQASALTQGGISQLTGGISKYWPYLLTAGAILVLMKVS